MSSDILLLYRRILKHALVFPSKNRLKIVKEIKVTFRENKNLQDPIKLQVRELKSHFSFLIISIIYRIQFM